MLQRIQSLLLAGVPVLVLVLLFVPVYSISWKLPETGSSITLLSGTFALVINLLPVVLAIFAAFRYKNRPQQIKLCMAGVVLSAAVLAVMLLIPAKLFPAMNAPDAVVSFSAGIFILPINVLLFFLASRYIRRDEELVRSADRLR
jgi:Domain of unknown function (DUF4293)